MIPTQFMFQYEMVVKDPDSGELPTSTIWTTMRGKTLLAEDPKVIEIKLVNNDTRN